MLSNWGRLLLLYDHHILRSTLRRLLLDANSWAILIVLQFLLFRSTIAETDIVIGATSYLEGLGICIGCIEDW